MTEDRFVLNRNDGVDVLHRNPSEVCNTDDAIGRQTIDPDTADALLAMGDAIRCRHCYQEEPRMTDKAETEKVETTETETETKERTVEVSQPDETEEDEE